MIEYSWKEQGKRIIIDGESTKPREMATCDVVSYLNELSKTFEKHRDVMLKLLKASLDGRDSSRIQDEVAKMLGYGGIDSFIRENYSKEYSKKECTHYPCWCGGMLS